MIVTLLTILIAIVSILLVLVVLIQNPKSGGVDSNFGGVAANQMFGVARTTDLIEKITWGLGATLFLLCIITAIYVASQTGSGVGVPLQSEG